MYYSEDELKIMAAPLSSTEDDQCKCAIRMVADALQDIGYSDTSEIKRLDPSSPSYSIRMVKRYQGEDIQLLIQGSYANNTNIRGESDVDIAVIDESHKMYGARKSNDTNDYLFVDGDTGAYAASLLRSSVKRALCGRFAGVEDGDKSIKVPGNTYRKSADVVPCVRFVDLTNYREGGTGESIDGVVLYSLSGETIVNYPEVHIAAGRHKNTRTDHWLRIEQSLLTLSIKLWSDQIQSVSIAAHLLRENEQDVLYYIYRTEPMAVERQRNPSQYGGGRLVIQSGASMAGQYWTTSATIGDMQLTRVFD